MPKISIVVPIYRVEKYLPICLDSLRAQTLKDIEIVCVNDGSPDRSQMILEQYAALDDRIVVICKDNGGVSSARNVGINSASSDLVCFVDPDDVLDRNACEVIVDAFNAYECDVLTYGGVAFPEHRSEGWVDSSLSPRDIIYGEFSPSILFEEKSHPYPWRTALRRKFLLDNNLLFDESLRFGEDECWHFSVYPRSRKTVFISNKLYRYRVEREDSLMATRAVDPVLKAYDHLRIVDKICADWHSLGLIDSSYKELLHHIAEFVLHDVIAAPSEGRMALLRFARSIFEAYFTEPQLDSLLRDRTYGGMARAVLVDGALAWRIKRKWILYSFTFKTNTLELFRAAWRRFWSIAPLARLKNGVKTLLPMSSRRQQYLADEMMSEISDATALISSKMLFDFERLNNR